MSGDQPIAGTTSDTFSGASKSTFNSFGFTTLALGVVPGLITTAIALFGVWFVEHQFHESPMSWYVYYFVPVGAAVVGFAAGSGYLIAAKLFGLRYGKVKLTLLFILQVIAYFTAQYIAFKARHLVYKSTHQPVGFWYHFHLTATSYVINQDGREPIHLDYLGYGLRALEIIIFACGALLWTGSLQRESYCKPCRCYRKKKMVMTIFAGEFVTLAEGVVGREAEQAVLDGANAAFDALATVAQAGSDETLDDQLREHPPVRLKSNLPTRLNVEILYCPTCFESWLAGNIVIKRATTSSTKSLQRRPISREFAQQLLGTHLKTDRFVATRAAQVARCAFMRTIAQRANFVNKRIIPPNARPALI